MGDTERRGASAVVPSFGQLLHGNKIYVGVTSIIGLAAFVAGVQMLIAASETGLGVLMATMVVLWVIATVHHVMLARPTPQPAMRPRPPSVLAH